MLTLHTWLASAFVQQLGWTLIHFVWQGVLIVLLARTGLWLLRRSRSSARYHFLLACFAALAVSPVVTFTFVGAENDAHDRGGEISGGNAIVAENRGMTPADQDFPAPPAVHQPAESLPVAELTPVTAAATAPAAVPSTPPPPTLAERCRPAMPWLVAGWIAGVLLLTLRLCAAWWRLRRMMTHHARPLVDRWATLTSHMLDAFDVHRRVRFLESRLADVPIVISWLRPIILVPTSVMTSLTPAEVEALLAHELAHIRRWDDVVNLLQTVIETLLFYHPAVWWISARLRQEREHCCDDLAAEMIGDRLVYSRALLAVAQLATTRPERLAVAATGGKLASRIRRLLTIPAPRSTQPQSRWPVVVLLLLAVLTPLAFAASLPTEREPVPRSTNSQPSTTSTGPSATSDAVRESTDAAPAEFTPAQLVAGIEQAMQRFTSVDYSAEYSEERNANAFRDGAEPLPVSGTGQYTFRTDGRRWYADELGFTYTIGTTDVRPTRAVSGFDGTVHYVREGDIVTLGEDHLAVERRAPAHVFWEIGRNWSWLKAALNDPSARVTEQPVIDGHRCVAVHSAWSPAWAGKTYVYDVVISPEQSFLPLKCTMTQEWQVEDEWQVTELAQTRDGVWYPKTIRTTHRQGLPNLSQQLTINSLALRNDFTDDDLVYPVPGAVDVVDYPHGRVYFNDPWHSELSAWMRDRFDFPSPWLQPTDEIGSHCDGTIHGKPAPAIEATEWINGDPGPWNRPGRQYTILFFFGGRLISPTPRWFAGLKALQHKYGEAGVELVGVASSSAGEDVRQTVRELNIAFPVAIATPSEKRGSEGRAYDAYGLSTYTGVFVIDPQGTVHLVRNPQPEGDAQLALEPLLQKLLGLPPEEFVRPDSGLPIEGWRATIDEWRRLRSTASEAGRIAGTVQYNHPIRRLPDYSGVEVTLTPLLRFVSGHTPYGHVVHSETSVIVRTSCDRDGNFEFTKLRKGTYTLTVNVPNYEKNEQFVAVTGDDTESPIDVKVLLNRSGGK